LMRSASSEHIPHGGAVLFWDTRGHPTGGSA
jgi:hypothetical protein